MATCILLTLFIMVLDLNNIQYSTFDFHDTNFQQLGDIDPDINFFCDTLLSQAACNSKYYNENSFNENCKELDVKCNAFSLMHINVRSFHCNSNSLEMYLNMLNHNFKILGISETWFNEYNVNTAKIDGYNTEHAFRSQKSGGGVSLFIDKSIKYQRRNDLCIFNDNIESIFIEIDKSQINTSRNVIVCELYRPPNTDLPSFTDYVNQILDVIKNENKIVYLMGDFNINLLNTDKHMLSSEFMEMMYSYACIPLINKPTRVTDNASATLIDNIYCNDIDQNIFQGICFTDVSDHFPVFCINLSKCNLQEPLYMSKRQITKENSDHFIKKLESIDWEKIKENDNCQEAYTMFHDQVVECYNECFPYKRYKVNYYNKKPWLTEGLKVSIKCKNKLYIKSVKYPSASNVGYYKQYRNKLNALLRIAEKDYYNSLLLLHKGNLKKSWSIIKTIINKNKSSSKSFKFEIDGKIVTDNQYIANEFNKFYTEVGPNLAKEIPPSTIDPLSYIKGSDYDTIFLKPVDEEEVLKILPLIKSDTPGYDDISGAVIKDSIKYYLDPLVYIFNLSLSQGIFPCELKIAKVVPLYKGGNEMLLTNYRPVSLLPFISKILERIMYNRLIDFVKNNKILHKYQFGFRENHSTNLALIMLIDKIVNARDNGESVLGVFLDFSKAFDTVNHEILLNKLQKYGIRGKCNNWFESYLSNRKQCVCFNGVTSNLQSVQCGVPQGSVLGPLLFLLYINDIKNISSMLFTLLFADDTNVFIHGKDINALFDNMNNEMLKIVQWLNVNKLSINIKKTNYMVFTKKNRYYIF